MKMISKAIITVSLLAMASTASAGHHRGESFYAKGRVISATPVYQTVRVAHIHDDSCWRSVRHHHGHREHHASNEVAATVVGAVIGGAVGHVLFKKSNLKGVGTVAGAVIGGSVGNEIGQNNKDYQSRRHSHNSGGYRHASHRKVLHCREEYTSYEEISGYEVTYKYQGEIYHTHTRHHPGKKIKLRVTVDPV